MSGALRPGGTLLAFLALAGAGPAVAQEGTSVLTLLEVSGRHVAPGVTAAGELTSADWVAGGRRVQAWAVEGEPGRALVVELLSDDFDSYLLVAGPGLGELSDDDSGEGTDARLCFETAEAGTYRLVASAYGNELGAFRLRAERRDHCAEERGAGEVTDLGTLETAGRRVPAEGEVQGMLTRGDPTLFGSPVQAWALEGEAGGAVTVDLVSAEFDAYLTVLGPGLEDGLRDDDGAGACDSRVRVRFPETGVYRVIASSVGGGTGSFALRAAPDPAPPSTEPCRPSEMSGGGEDPSAGSIDELPVAGVIAPGDSRPGLLQGEERYRGRRGQRWTLEGRQGQRLAIEERSADFDAYLHLRGPGIVPPIVDDDGAGTLDARICVLLPATGTYEIVPSSLGPDGRGAYTLTVIEEPGADRCPSFALALTVGLAALPLEEIRLRVGDEVTAALEMDDSRHPGDGSAVDVWGIELEAGQRIVVDLISADFDALAYLIGPGLGAGRSDDDGGGRCNARIEVIAPETGLYRFVANTFGRGGGGAYALRIGAEAGPTLEGECSPPAGNAGAVVSGVGREEFEAAMAGGGRTLALGVEAEGILGADDPRRGEGAAMQAWALRLSAGQAVALEVASTEFDAYLFVVPPTGPVLENDDGPAGTDARLTFEAPGDGIYHVIVTTFAAGGTGAYYLQALRRSASR